MGLIDVAPTILDYLHIPAPPSFYGQSLLTAGKARPIFGESVHAYDAFGWSPLRSLRTGDFKYIEAPRPELYNLASDPRELKNLAATDTARTQTMHDELAKLMAGLHPKGAAPTTNLSRARPRAARLAGLCSAGAEDECERSAARPEGSHG